MLTSKLKFIYHREKTLDHWNAKPHDSQKNNIYWEKQNGEKTKYHLNKWKEAAYDIFKININKNKFVTTSSLPRAIGLWLWDTKKYTTTTRAIDIFNKAYHSSDIEKQHHYINGYNDINQLKKLLAGAAKCIESMDTARPPRSNALFCPFERTGGAGRHGTLPCSTTGHPLRRALQQPREALPHFRCSSTSRPAGTMFSNAPLVPGEGSNMDDRDKPLLLILDGLDELSLQGRSGEEAARQLLEEVRSAVSIANYDKLSLRCLITGRDLAVQAVEQVFHLASTSLHILPYWIAKEKETQTPDDPARLLDTDQRDEWWRKYGLATGMNFNGMPVLCGQKVYRN